jgi:hypothetical protein
MLAGEDTIEEGHIGGAYMRIARGTGRHANPNGLIG